MKPKKLFLLIKKTLVPFFLFNILFLSFSFLTIESSRVNYSSFAAYLVNQRKNNGLSFNYGEVKTNNLTNYNSFYWYADNIPGANLKGNMHTFFKAVPNDGDSYLIKNDENNFFKTDVLLYTTWNFKNYHYNFKVITNEKDFSINTNEVYITEALAKKIFGITNANYYSILEKEIFCQSNKITIKGVILNESLSFFENTVGKDFILGNFNYKPFTIKKMIYSFIMFGEIIDTTTAVTSIEKTIKSINSNSKQIESYYYDYNNTFTIDKSQKIKEATLSVKGYNYPMLFISLVTFIFSITSVIFFEIVSIKKTERIKKFKAKTNTILISNYLFISFCFLISLLILRCINFIIVNEKAIYLFNYNLISSLFLFWILISSLNGLLTYFWKGKCNQKHNLVFEYNTIDI